MKSKKKKRATKSLRLKANKSGSFESHNWSAPDGGSVPLRPAWYVDRNLCQLDLCRDETLVSLKLTLNHNPHLIAIFCKKVINQYYRKGIEITPGLRHLIVTQVETFMKKTGDIFEPL